MKELKLTSRPAFRIATGVTLTFSAFMIWLAVKRKREKQSEQNSSNSSSTEPAFSCTRKAHHFPIKYGSCGMNVTRLQNYLNSVSQSRLEVDGMLGPKTESAMITMLDKTELEQAAFEKLVNYS